MTKATKFLTLITLLGSIGALYARTEMQSLSIPLKTFVGDNLKVQENLSIAGSAHISNTQVGGEASIFGCFFAQNSSFHDLIIYAASYDRNVSDVQKILSNMESGFDVALVNCTVTGECNVIAANNVLLNNTVIKNIYLKPKLATPISVPQVLELRGKKCIVSGEIVFEGGNGKVVVHKGVKIDPKLKITGGTLSLL